NSRVDHDPARIGPLKEVVTSVREKNLALDYDEVLWFRIRLAHLVPGFRWKRQLGYFEAPGLNRPAREPRDGSSYCLQSIRRQTVTDDFCGRLATRGPVRSTQPSCNVL